MKRIVLFSGGLDSTTCLLKAIENMKKNDQLFLYYFDLGNNSTKSWCEKNAINAILAELKLENLIDKNLEVNYQSIGTVDDINGYVGAIPPQSLMWLDRLKVVLHDYINDIKSNNLEIYLGYTKGDDAINMIDLIEKYWDASVESLYNVKCPLYYPVMGMSKRGEVSYILEFENKNNLDVLQKTWTCENPKLIHTRYVSGYEQCSECIPCKRMKKATRNL
jgi:7-cyano-7-deazaguanine synthase in queuosine biosynthesis